ncbi:Signal peptidase I [compost metagenome]
MDENQKRKNLKGTWNQAILTFLFPILLVMGLRWAVIEPFVIPSGSMIPNLLVYDHILVKKFSYGLHIPFSTKWLLKWDSPKRGDIVVFRYPENPEIYYIKRLIGLPGDDVLVQDGKVTVNGHEWELLPESLSSIDAGFNYYEEKIPEGSSHRVRFVNQRSLGEVETQVFKVPKSEYFFMGDNRDQSSDGRVWGFVKDEYLVGKASMIWLSCDQTLPSLSYVCDPSQIRWSRLFKFLH